LPSPSGTLAIAVEQCLHRAERSQLRITWNEHTAAALLELTTSFSLNILWVAGEFESTRGDEFEILAMPAAVMAASIGSGRRYGDSSRGT